MIEVFQASFSPINLFYTIFLILMLLYWFTVILGALDVGFLDFDIDLDADVDVDVDVDMDADVEGGGVDAGWFAAVLSFFNFGRIPFMIIMSFLALSMWMFSILTNHYFGQGSVGFALAMALPNLCVGLVATKLITSPLVPIFDKLDGSVEPVDYIGQVCTIKLPASSTQLGQAEVSYEDSPLLINVKIKPDQSDPVLKGDQALVVGKEDNGKFFWVQKLEVS